MKIGFLINPVAGMGGKVALKGTDGEETLRRALELGAVPMAGTRAEEAVKEFAENAGDCRFYSPSGGMGADLLKSYGLETELLFDPSTHTTPADTKRAAEMMLERGVGLVVFAGGDGTARDICSVIGERLPVVGIPAGVKIHSGVYAKRPKDAGLLINNFLLGKVKRFTTAEVVDIDEDAFRDNIVRARLYGYMMIPDDREFMQDRKSGGSGGSTEEAANLAAFMALSMKPGVIYLIGSGSTTKQLTDRLGLDGTLLGVDAVRDGKLIGKDLTEAGIKEILSGVERNKRVLIITVIGGQGHIFGRGNQQLSPEVIRMIPKENITVIATPAKMAQLFGKSLIADTGDCALDRELSGYIPVVTGHARKMMAKVS
ncbi:ATP-NAD kinase family protein [Cloacibacillus porcorum]|uniref:ATP-NAD kinase family protein n=1 Tax=Cloacibacillus porcorum TaxID=1197717 RepID=UPI002352876F|nr:ATP-NAD kinase family protein [Cloacibacillus porcorum]MCI5865233.1 ATP-NAD kinase family protein [Cloacibacillus porcorum]MDD7650305.1 ATP-NAD kinase family protein [Cloacibacillus porcorum]MDY4094368.1 ATP-NAD kinase family protein [Cloacibacillus porcorum]